LPRFQSDFTEKALVEYAQKRLSERLKSPFRELTRYGVLLRRYDLPVLQAVFPEYFQNRDALDIFHQLNDYPYVESLGDQYHAFHDLLREIQAAEIRKQQPSEWQTYHRRALEYLAQNDPDSPDRYYHMIALDEEQGISDWWDAVTNPRHYGSYLGALFQAANDVTLALSPTQDAHRLYRTGVNNYMGARMSDALSCYQEAFSLYRQVGSSLGEANVRKAIGDVQQFRDEREAALASYEAALSLFRQVGSSLGEANCFQSLGHLALEQDEHQRALEFYNDAYRLYCQIEDRYSQTALLFYRSFVYEAMEQFPQAIHDMEQALALAQQLSLSQVEACQERLDELRGQA
ncbi:MAG TPA: tetratricopeptide repeat protein, partial [Ktedonobacteraceae bacterium]|nr:tetratricopeptide repeat protein [Ktedonobacteraceae bacterium]